MATKKEKEELIATLKFTPRTYTLYIGGYGGEAYAGRVDRAVYDYFKEKKIDIEEYAVDWDDNFSDVPRELQPFSPGSPYDCDNLFHASGAELSSLNEIQVTDENGKDHWTCAAGLNELEDAGVTVNQFDGFDFEDLADNEVAFWGGQGEKGGFFEGSIELTQPFDPKKLTINYENCDGWWLINCVEYDGEEIDGSNGYSTTGKWNENKWICGSAVDEYEPVSREGQEEDDDESAEWVKPHETGTDNPVDFPPMPKLPTTDWFPMDVKPVRKGMYECEVEIVTWPWPAVSKYEWSGRAWKDGEGKTVKGLKQWRGLSVDPAELEINDE